MVVRVLIVDDVAPFRAAARMVVEATIGFEVVGEAITGEESVELARRLAPDLILMDIQLPGIDGMEATRRIRAHDNGPVVLLVSTREHADPAALATGCGAAGYIPKAEFGPDRLARVAAECLTSLGPPDRRER